MAVESKLGETKLGVGANGANGTSNGTSNGAATPVVAEGTMRTKRTSSLRRSATALPKVEHSLDEFIARANQTLVDVSGWGNADQKAREEDEKRREQDAQRWKQAEQQMRESEARESALRRQLDGLQGQLAEAEARVAVAMSGSFPAATPAQDKALEDLRRQIEDGNQRLRASEQKSQELARALDLAKTEVHARAAIPVDVHDSAADERVALAEAKAAKALAAARAAAAGLTVSSADLAAIESGLVVPMAPQRRTPWIPIMLAFAGGLGLMFVLWKFVLSTPTADPKPQAAPEPAKSETRTAPAPAPTAAPAPVQPSVTPIDEPKPSVTPIEPAKAADPAPAKAEPAEPTKAEPVEPAHDPAPAKAAPKAEPPKAVVKQPTPPPRPVVRQAPPQPKAAPAKKPQIEDPFATPAAKKPAPAPAKKSGGGIVDPF